MKVDSQHLPAHVGIIMDGNGRWAQLRGLPRVKGHHEGAKAVRRVVQAGRKIGLPAMTLYAFSEQNWFRPETEVRVLMHLLRTFLLNERDELMEQGVSLHAVGNLHKLPDTVRSVMEQICQETAHNRNMRLTLALSYGGREEITEAARALAREVALGQLAPAEVTEEALRKHMPSLAVGDPDLVIRTGGELRVSNFLLYGLAYTELYFAETLWPDFSEKEFYEAIASFQTRVRRFGRSEQVDPPPMRSTFLAKAF